ncbi:MAG: hypothetical protein NC079_09045 [Clostridium sp.]|nr:hypothetical protein [Acetatifactor muris]MCM1527733.1 hypothetical protein [Bacteroides sp.]MCM1563736.1 hypothetical protein [Clostridium sp.]
MSVSAVNETRAGSVYDNYDRRTTAAAEEKKDSTVGETAADQGAVYEKTTADKKATYSVNKMSSEERAALVRQMQADQASRQQQLANIVHNMLNGQAKTYANAGGNSIWSTLAGGNFTVDAATQAQAQKDIAEDGYWGVNQTAKRLFDFASALAGDDVDKMKEMQAAMEKGFKMATKTWGGQLPGICQDTMSAAGQLFDDYYASKGVTA